MVTLQWIPSHNDIADNETVDDLAKNAINLQNIEELPLMAIDTIDLKHISYNSPDNHNIW